MIFKNALIDGRLLDIKVEGGKITELGRFPDEGGTDLCGKKVQAGLVDIHIHGALGFDTMDADADALAEISRFLAKNGTTAFLATTMTEEWEKIKKATEVDVPADSGASLLGFHIEGPYISEKYRGAQSAEWIKAPDPKEFSTLRNVRRVTIAPEKRGSAEFIKKCGALVSIGHTEADYDTAIAAIDAGAVSLTHTFNAMPPLLHRAPGPIGAAIDKNIYVEVICDGNHLSASAVKMLYRTFGRDRMILVSDSMRAAGLPDGEYELGGQTVSVRGSVARTRDGALAGSTLALLDCVKKAIEIGIPESDAFYTASRTPADLLGEKKGRIAPGYDADFIVLDDKNELIMTVINGNIV